MRHTRDSDKVKNDAKPETKISQKLREKETLTKLEEKPKLVKEKVRAREKTETNKNHRQRQKDTISKKKRQNRSQRQKKPETEIKPETGKKIHKARIRDKNRDGHIAKIRDRDRDTEYLGSSLGLPGQAAGVLETATSLTEMQNPSNIFRVSQECVCFSFFALQQAFSIMINSRSLD